MKEQIIRWWLTLKLVLRAAFRVDFVLDHAKRILSAYVLVAVRGD